MLSVINDINSIIILAAKLDVILFISKLGANSRRINQISRYVNPPGIGKPVAGAIEGSKTSISIDTYRFFIFDLEKNETIFSI